MKNASRLFLLGALALVLLTTACAGQQGSPTPTTLPTSTAATDTPTVAVSPTDTTTATPNTTLTPGIPLTGSNVSLVCQFCVDTLAHALLVIPAEATVTILTPTATVSPTNGVSIGCTSVETTGDKQVVLCRGEQNTPILLNICEGNNCLQFTVQLQPCPPRPVNTATMTPTVSKTPTSTLAVSATPTFTPPVASPTTAATSTPTASGATATSTTSPTPTPTFTPTTSP